MSDAACAICLASLTSRGSDGSETNTSLVCSHTFHSYCIQQYCETQKLDIHEIKCPCCKRTNGDCNQELEPAAVEDLDAGADATTDGGHSSDCADVPERVVMARPAFDSPSVFCSSCGNQVTIQKCRILSKKARTWRCTVCDCKVTQLHRGFGHWPPQEFAALDPAQQQEFFRSVASVSGPGSIAKCRELLRQHETHEQFYEFGGEFLPLNVWKTRGFDDSAILEKSGSDDIKVHPVLGTVYRVKTLKAGSRGAEGATRSSNTGAPVKKVKLSEPLVAEAPVLAAAADAADKSESSNESSDSDASDSSRSSSKHKKTKKSKKNAKHKKNKKEKKGKKAKNGKSNNNKEEESKLKKEKLLADKAQAVKEKANSAMAGQIVNKLVVPLANLTLAMSKPGTFRLPAFVTDSARDHLDKLQTLNMKAKFTAADPSKDLPVQTLKDVQKMITEAKKTETLMSQLLATMDKMTA